MTTTPIPPPMNGTKTHPLTTHAFEALCWLARAPQPTSEINPGVSNRLMREELIEQVSLPSPYKTHKGKKIPFLQITDAGRARVKEGK